MLLRRRSGLGWPSRKSEMLDPWLVRESEQPSYRHTCARGAAECDLSTLNRVREATVAKPNPGESPEIGGDRDVDFSASGRLETHLDVIGTQNEPPIPWTAIALGDAAKIETNDEALRRYLGKTDLPSHPPQEHFRIEVIGADQTLCPALAPHAHQLHDRPEILSGWRQSIEMTFALGLRFNVHNPVLLKLFEALRQDRARYEWRGSEQLAKTP